MAGNTLLCWNSVRAGNDVLNNAVKSLKNRKIEVDKVWLLLQKGHDSQLSTQNGVELTPQLLELEDPTQHKPIYDAIVSEVLPQIPLSTNLHINISPGTPAMHAVWLILHAGGRLPQDTKLWSSQFNPKTKRSSIKPVEFPINTYLSEIRRVVSKEDGFAAYDLEPKSESRKEAFAQLKRYADLPGIPILVLGERGTGKTRLIEMTLGALKQKEIVTVACGSLDSHLAESQLFGHVKGAFTGADQDRDGLLKAANDGILFLDEIQDLPKDIQRKLVRVLQDNKRRFRPVGSDKEVSVNFELVCASNKDTKTLQKVLDADFYDRISMTLIEIPPLRTSRQDLERDWQQVWNELCLASKLPSIAPSSPALLDILRNDPLHGNLRDLQKLAVLMMAWWSEKDIDKTISEAVRRWKKQREQEYTQNAFEETSSREAYLKRCKHEFASWAKQKYITWEKAAKALKCSEKTLRNDATFKK
nr:sigma 54-interacting transcriptional regulator [uncultured Pseudodesulfovibrio sp.]